MRAIAGRQTPFTIRPHRNKSVYASGAFPGRGSRSYKTPEVLKIGSEIVIVAFADFLQRFAGIAESTSRPVSPAT